jgi:aspartate/methionine/tyrosine aminotransferase
LEIILDYNHGTVGRSLGAILYFLPKMPVFLFINFAVSEAATRAMRHNFTHYGNSFGEEGLRQAVCLGLRRDFGAERKPENVLITSGGIEAIHVIDASYINPGDEVLIPDPEYSAYADPVALCGGVPVLVSLQEDLHLDFLALKRGAEIEGDGKARHAAL